MERTAESVGGSLHDFLRDEHGKHPKHPQILIAGSSLSGMGFHVEELEKRTGMPTAKIALPSSTPTDMLDILECYPNECQYAKVLLLELAPERLVTPENDAARRRFFDEMRGVKQFDLQTDFLKRSSMLHFLPFFRKFFQLPRTILYGTPRRFEKRWDDPHHKVRTEPYRIPLRQQAEQARKDRELSISKNLPPTVRAKLQYEEEHIEAVYRLLDLCRTRNVFVVVCVMPQWYGTFNFTQNNLETPTKEPYLLLLQDLHERPGCSVIICRDFEEITNEGTDEDFLFDFGHMTRQGAIVYTNWLADRLMETPKIADAIHQRPPIEENKPLLSTRPSISGNPF